MVNMELHAQRASCMYVCTVHTARCVSTVENTADWMTVRASDVVVEDWAGVAE
jgi:hypothetical protein